MARDRLSDTQLRHAKRSAKPYKLYDGGGLYLLVQPNGSRYWRLKYRLGGKEKVFAIGVYPDVSLADARTRAFEARRLIMDGNDPVIERKRSRVSKAALSAETFQAIAEEYIASRANVWSASYKESVESALRVNLYPHIGSLPIRSITVTIMRDALLLMEKRDVLAVLRKVRMWASNIFRYAIATGRADADPAGPLRGTFKVPHPRHFAAVTDRVELGSLLAKIKAYEGFVTRHALLLMAYTFLRPKELRFARWSEIDFEKKVWRVPLQN